MKLSGDPEFQFCWGMLPRWRKRGCTYFVTWRLRRGCSDLESDERGIVQHALMHADGRDFRLHANVVMNDHLHGLVTRSREVALDRIVRAWQSVSSRRIQRMRITKAGLWQDEYFDRIVRDEAGLAEKAQYIVNNPRKRWPKAEEYPWVGFEDMDVRRGGSEDSSPLTSDSHTPHGSPVL